MRGHKLCMLMPNDGVWQDLAKRFLQHYRKFSSSVVSGVRLYLGALFLG